MDIALKLEAMGFSKYGGSVTANNEQAYNAIRWNEEAPKPAWAELEAMVIVEPVNDKAEAIKTANTVAQLRKAVLDYLDL